ncbi:ATP-binding protein [bacterium]|nr:ATP-binding protein [bacterium]
MKSLNTILGLQLLVGSLVALVVSMGIQAFRFHSEAVRRADEGVGLAVQEVAWEIGRQRDAALDGAMLAAQQGASDGEGATSNRGGPASVILEFDGDLRERVARGEAPGVLSQLVEMIRSASVAGVTGAHLPSSAVVAVDGEPWVIAAADHVGGEGSRSVLVRPLDLRLVRALHPEVEFAFHDLNGESPPNHVAGALDQLLTKGGGVSRDAEPQDAASGGAVSPCTVSARSGGGAVGMQLFRDGMGRPGLVVSATQVPSAAASILAVARELVIFQLLAAGIAALVALRFLIRFVRQPLHQIHGHVTQLTASSKAKSRLHRWDALEFQRLDQALMGMIDKVAVDRQTVVHDARRAGMSDVSMGVVHAAGNILNSINVSTKLLLRDVAAVDVTDMHSLARELEEHSEDLSTYITENENGKFLVPFIIAMADAVGDLRSRCIVELESLDLGLSQAIDLIRSQEKYAVGPSIEEEVELSGVVERALEVATTSLPSVVGVEIERDFDGAPLVRTDSHRLKSVLINVIVNAFEALQGPDLRERRIVLRVYGTEDRRVVVEVTDTGCGIDPGSLDQIFTSSFTSKEGHAGEGLHMAANVCQELGIAIGVMSEGPGAGSSIKLRIPTVGSAERAETGPGASEPEPAPTQS